MCGGCGRYICIDRDVKRNVQRWNFPFKTEETAMLYLRTAEASLGKPCGIYEMTANSGRQSYKIFETDEAMLRYIAGQKGKSGRLVYRSKVYRKFPGTQIRKLSREEIERYLMEQALPL